MVIYSMSDALQPAISYCFGAGLLPRMRKMQRVVMSAAAILVPIWQLDGVWVLNFVSSVFSAVVAVVIAKKALKPIEAYRQKLITAKQNKLIKTSAIRKTLQ